MQRLETRLFIHHDDNSSFNDISNEAQDYARDTTAIVLHNSEDYLYIGFRKPINAIYFEMATANTNANSFAFQYYTGSASVPAWTSITANQHNDESKGWTRSGFLNWERNLIDEGSVEINSQTAFWYRLRPSAEHSAGTILRGINIVFSDDQDLRTAVPSITNSKFLAAGETSHILSHVGARDEMIQEMRNSGKFKINFNTGEFKDFNAFDLLQIGQLREASKWKTLSTIFNDLVDSIDDPFLERAMGYDKKYNAAMATYFLNIDIDDDGVEDVFEELVSDTPSITRR